MIVDVRETLDEELAACACSSARAFIACGRPLPSCVVDLAMRVARSKEGRKALRAQNPPRELIAALERGGVRL